MPFKVTDPRDYQELAMAKSEKSTLKPFVILITASALARVAAMAIRGM